MTDIEEIEEMQRQLDQTKSKRDKLLGQKETLVKTLKDEYQIKNTAHAKKVLLSLKEKARIIKGKISDGIAEAKKYNWS